MPSINLEFQKAYMHVTALFISNITNININISNIFLCVLDSMRTDDVNITRHMAKVQWQVWKLN